MRAHWRSFVIDYGVDDALPFERHKSAVLSGLLVFHSRGADSSCSALQLFGTLNLNLSRGATLWAQRVSARHGVR